jgi:hypothetical protein
MAQELYPIDMECPAFYVAVLVRETVQKGAEDGEGKEAYAWADREFAAADRSCGGEREDDWIADGAEEWLSTAARAQNKSIRRLNSASRQYPPKRLKASNRCSHSVVYQTSK